MLVGFVLGGPPGRGMARQPPASCGLTGRAMDDRSAGVHAGGAPTSDNLPDQFAIDRRATAWMARRCAVLGREARHIRARVEPCPMGREPGKDARLPIAPSRTTGRRQDAADAAQSPAARRAAKNKPSHHPDHHRSSRQDAGVDERFRHPCGSRRTRRRCANLNAYTVTSARRLDHVRTKGAGHGCPAPWCLIASTLPLGPSIPQSRSSPNIRVGTRTQNLRLRRPTAAPERGLIGGQSHLSVPGRGSA